MPLRNQTRTPEDKIRAYVLRHLEGGESATALAKEAGVSRPGFYAWVNKHKDAEVEKAKQRNMSPVAIKNREKRDLMIENGELRKENKLLRQKLFELMVETGKL